MERLRLRLIISSLLLINSIASSAQYHKNLGIANKVLSEFVSNYYTDSMITFSGSKIGYNLNANKRIYIIRVDSNTLNNSCRLSDDFQVDNNFYKKLNNSDIEYIISDNFVDEHVNIFLSNISYIELIGHVFTINIYTNSSIHGKSYYIIPFLYSKSKQKLIKIDSSIYLSP